MSKMTGWRFIPQLKVLPGLAKIPIIIYTTSKLQSDVEEAERLGAAHFMIKPTKLDALKSQIKFVFSNIPPEAVNGTTGTRR